MSNSAEEILTTLSNLSAELMLVENSDSEGIDRGPEGLDDIKSQFDVLRTLEDSDRVPRTDTASYDEELQGISGGPFPVTAKSVSSWTRRRWTTSLQLDFLSLSMVMAP